MRNGTHAIRPSCSLLPGTFHCETKARYEGTNDRKQVAPDVRPNGNARFIQEIDQKMKAKKGEVVIFLHSAVDDKQQREKE
jgi:hypothetical protein